MNSLKIHEADAELLALLEAVSAGAEVLISKGGTPVARLVPIEARKSLPWGLLKEKITLADNFDTPLPPEILAEFERPL